MYSVPCLLFDLCPMLSTRQLAPRVVGELLRGQPLSPAKVRFAWRTTVGSSMAQATSVTLDANGTLLVRADGEHWRRETARSAGVIARRLGDLLGKQVVKRVTVRRNW